MSDDAIGGSVAPVVEAVVETPVVEAVAEQDKSAPQVGETDAPTGEESQAEKTFTQKELDDILEKKTAKLQRIRDTERNKRQELERELAKVSVPKDEGRPNPANYDDVERYASDVASWELGKRDRIEQAAKTQVTRSDFETKAAELHAELADMPDFDEAKWNKLPISDAMAKAIVQSDMGEKVAKHLYSNPSEADRIAHLSQERQLAEIGKLEERLSSAPKVSKAPAPINPIGKGNAVSTKSPENMSMAEYIEHRKKQGARWA